MAAHRADVKWNSCGGEPSAPLAFDARAGGRCFGNFKQLFASGREFIYSLEHIGRCYTRLHRARGALGHGVLPGKELRLQHEQLVEDFEPQVRRILDSVGVDFEPACLEFYKSGRSVRTASSEQVRQPIFKEGIE